MSLLSLSFQPLCDQFVSAVIAETIHADFLLQETPRASLGNFVERGPGDRTASSFESQEAASHLDRLICEAWLTARRSLLLARPVRAKLQRGWSWVDRGIAAWSCVWGWSSVRAPEERSRRSACEPPGFPACGPTRG